jgi:hypothetical protein
MNQLKLLTHEHYEELIQKVHLITGKLVTEIKGSYLGEIIHDLVTIIENKDATQEIKKDVTELKEDVKDGDVTGAINDATAAVTTAATAITTADTGTVNANATTATTEPTPK